MRYISPYVLEDLQKKMVFIGGARQVGKTTLAKAVLSRDFSNGRYLNWDFDEDRQDIFTSLSGFFLPYSASGYVQSM